MTAPARIVLDDVDVETAGRCLVRHLDWRLAAGDDGAQMLYVSHHLDEPPRCLTHALVLQDGCVRAAGPRHPHGTRRGSHRHP